jgi:hypothetical protein
VNPFVSLLGTAALVAAPLHPGDAAKRDRYQKMADGLAWKDSYPVGHSLAADLVPDFQLHLVVKHTAGGSQTRVVIESRDGKQELYAWDEHGQSAFVVCNGIIYRAEYSGISSGCAIIAFDLKAGKELWKATLKGLGPIDHSKYHNRVRMEKVDNTVFAVYGEESAGKYVELVEYATGRTLGHKVFPKE